MTRFGKVRRLPVREPFRLDLTVDALRRLASNAVDVVDACGTYYRAVGSDEGAVLLAVRASAGGIELRATSGEPDRWVPIVRRLLGTEADLSDWYERCREIDWLASVADALRGLKPPRYPTLWEACAHAIVFQQISIHAAAAIMRRAVEKLGDAVAVDGIRCIAFPAPHRWLRAGDDELRAAGLSQNKCGHLRAAAAEFARGTVDETQLDALPTPEAAERLCRIRGIGPWSAAVMLLRGLGRLDTFPIRDSGVARSLALVSGDSAMDQSALLERLGPVRGMLYYHLLLGRLRNLVPAER